jgi:hypothetical protein
MKNPLPLLHLKLRGHIPRRLLAAQSILSKIIRFKDKGKRFLPCSRSMARGDSTLGMRENYAESVSDGEKMDMLHKWICCISVTCGVADMAMQVLRTILEEFPRNQRTNSISPGRHSFARRGGVRECLSRHFSRRFKESDLLHPSSLTSLELTSSESSGRC